MPAIRMQRLLPRCDICANIAAIMAEQTAPTQINPHWLATPLGEALLASETRAVAQSLDHVFGLNLVQVGCWGQTDQFTAHARVRHRAVVDTSAAPGISGLCRASRLSIASDSVDAVLLPHTLELDAEPHTVLREAQRVLVGDGHLIVLGFNPWSAYGLRRLIARGGFPHGAGQLIPEYRLRDWLALLGFEVCLSQRCAYAPPVNRVAVQRRLAGFDAWAGRYLPALAGAYVLVAKKRVYSVTPMRPAWSRKPRVAAGLVEPTTRSAA